jgi:hypothetical protein
MYCKYVFIFDIYCRGWPVNFYTICPKYYCWNCFLQTSSRVTGHAIHLMYHPFNGSCIVVYWRRQTIKPHLHEQILFDKFHMSKIFCSCRWSLWQLHLNKSYSMLAFDQMHLIKWNLSNKICSCKRGFRDKLIKTNRFYWSDKFRSDLPSDYRHRRYLLTGVPKTGNCGKMLAKHKS